MENLKPRDDPADTRKLTRVSHPGDQEEPPGVYGACGLLETASVSVSVCDKVLRLHLWLMATGLETVSDD